MNIMKAIILVVLLPTVSSAQLVITGVCDGPLTGGLPKIIELVALSDIADMSIFGLGSANSGSGISIEEFTFPVSSAVQGQVIYVSQDTDMFTAFFGFAPTYDDPGYATSVNGDDAIELFRNGEVVDVFGDIYVDGTGTPWDYLDGWAYRKSFTGPDGSTFILDNWIFSGANNLEGGLTNDTCIVPIPIGTYGFDPTYFPQMWIEDCPNDQGGFLNINWHASSLDVDGLPIYIITYEVQRFEMGIWGTIFSVEANQAEAYQATISTPDVFTVGQLEPYSQYRVLANSIDPYRLYYSNVDSSFSIDNLAPPKPDVTMYEGANFRYIIYTVPSIPDLDQVCFYRSTISELIPDEPILCLSELFFVETQLNNYYYWVQFSDIHGNLSEFSDELSLQFPSGIGDLPSSVFSLGQNQPNPFNPSTKIRFSLPKRSNVSLRVFDASGWLVKTLIDGQVMEAGSRESVWDGVDDADRQVASGTYFYRLEAGEFSETKKMTLLK